MRALTARVAEVRRADRAVERSNVTLVLVTSHYAAHTLRGGKGGL